MPELTYWERYWNRRRVATAARRRSGGHQSSPSERERQNYWQRTSTRAAGRRPQR